MKRHKHSLSHYRLLTCDMGKLIPIAATEVLPGDTIQQASSALIRVTPQLAPVMHPVSVRIHHWFVPHRLTWDGWEDFITGGPDGEGGDSGAYPTLTAPGGGFVAGSIPDYMGVPTGVAGIVVGAMPIRAYNLIFNEYYRDQDLVTEVTEDQLACQQVAWEKDYFTSARPWPQKGPDVTLPLGTSAPVTGAVSGSLSASGALTLLQAGGNANTTLVGKGVNNQDAGWDANSNVTNGPASYVSGLAWAQSGSTLSADLASATAVNVNDVRRAFALQRYQEARSLYGSRYVEYLRYLGVRSSDARLQRPEYLGGGKQTISFTEVLQTGPDTSDEGVANLKGHGIAAMRSRRYRRFFEEHGVVVSMLSIRPRSIYANGLEKMWTRRTKEDYWQKELENIGQQEIQLQEVYAQGSSADDDTFGYQDRYSEYRHKPSGISGEFRSTLNYWHLARIFGSAPTLNADFVECDPSKRIFAEQTSNSLWIMVNHSIQARRMVARTGVGRIL